MIKQEKLKHKCKNDFKNINIWITNGLSDVVGNDLWKKIM